MFLKNLRNRVGKALIIFMLALLSIQFLFPAIYADSFGSDHDYPERDLYSNLDFNFEAYFAVIDYNDINHPWVQIYYYYENGSKIRMIYGIDELSFRNLELNFLRNNIPVFDSSGNIYGYGIKTKYKSNLYVFIPLKFYE
jgi:hypothetical protein